MSQGAPVFWITGLSNAGKSTVSALLVERLTERGMRPVFLDGNQVRDALGVDGGFDESTRRRMGMTYAKLSHLFSSQGHAVVCATISLFHEVHAWNRAHIGNYHEVLLDVPLTELARRDTRGIYNTHDNSNVAGLGVAVEFPVAADLVIKNYGGVTPDEVADQILQLWDGSRSTSRRAMADGAHR
jgi:adenylylsulfate kinase